MGAGDTESGSGPRARPKAGGTLSPRLRHQTGSASDWVARVGLLPAQLGVLSSGKLEGVAPGREGELPGALGVPGISPTDPNPTHIHPSLCLVLVGFCFVFTAHLFSSSSTSLLPDLARAHSGWSQISPEIDQRGVAELPEPQFVHT